MSALFKEWRSDNRRPLVNRTVLFAGCGFRASLSKSSSQQKSALRIVIGPKRSISEMVSALGLYRGMV